MMRDVAPNVDIERSVFVLFNEADCAVEDMGIAAAGFVSPSGLLFFTVDVHGIDTVRAVLFIGADVPLAEVAGAVAGLVQEIGDCNPVTEAAVGRIDVIRRRELAGHQTGASGATGDTG